MASIYDWSTTPASNATSDGDMTWAEGQAPSTVNNSARQLVGRVAELLADIGGSLAAGGTANGITVTANSSFTTYADGRLIAFKAASDNTGATTLNVNGIGAKAIRRMGSTGDVALGAGAIEANGIYVVRYNSSLNSSAGGWQLLNPVLDALFSPIAGSSSIVTVGALNSGSITSGFGNIDIGSSTFTTTGAVSTGALTATTVTGTTGTFSGVIKSTGGNIDLELGAARFRQTSAGSSLIVAATGGSVILRPTDGSGTGQLVITTAGTVTPGGDILAGSNNVTVNTNGGIGPSGSNNVLFAANSGTIVFRPNGLASSSNQGTYSTAGDFVAAGNITANSDIRLKKSIKPIKGALGLVKSLRGVSFKRRKVNTKGIGFIAQEVETVLPELVHEQEGMKSVAYGNFTAVLVEAVKELAAKVERLEARK